MSFKRFLFTPERPLLRPLEVLFFDLLRLLLFVPEACNTLTALVCLLSLLLNLVLRAERDFDLCPDPFLTVEWLLLREVLRFAFKVFLLDERRFFLVELTDDLLTFFLILLFDLLLLSLLTS